MDSSENSGAVEVEETTVAEQPILSVDKSCSEQQVAEMDLLETPPTYAPDDIKNNNIAFDKTEEEDVVSMKEEIPISNENSESPGEKKMDDTNINTPPNNNTIEIEGDNVDLLNFGDTAVQNSVMNPVSNDIEQSNQEDAQTTPTATTTNDFDLLGFPQTEPTNNSPPDGNNEYDVFGNTTQNPVVDDNQTADTRRDPDTINSTEPIQHNLLDMSYGEGVVNSNNELSCSDIITVDNSEQQPQNLSEKVEEKDTDKEDDITPVNNTEANTDLLQSTEHSESSDDVVTPPEQQPTLLENKVGDDVSISENVDNEGISLTQSEGNQIEEQPTSKDQAEENMAFATPQRDVGEGAVTQSESENDIVSNEGIPIVDEQKSGYGESPVGEQSVPEGIDKEDTKQHTADFTSPPPLLPVDTASSIQNEAAENEVVEERTEEEEEWLSMGLGLGDALRQIVALTDERDSALIICREKEDGKSQAEALLVEVQSRLEAEMNRRAESDSEVRKVRETLKSYEERLAGYEKMEDTLEQVQANLVTVVTEKSKLELEVQKLREIRDESEQKEVVLSNRLNDAKKKEANKSTAAGRLEADNEALREELKSIKAELETTSKMKAKLENNMEKLKTKAVERVKQAETALAEERELNEERKKKMKVFVETKADELREAKDSANDMQKELEETRASLRSSRDREETFQKELDAARLKHREIQREMERMKRNSEQIQKMGNNLEQELEKSASETEEHKKKRMSAKHEIMQMVRTLEAERAVSSKLRESVKFTFTPKALSQQELLTEALRDFELELERLAHKTGKTLQPSPESSLGVQPDSTEASDTNGAYRKKKTRSKADMDTERLISNLEQETQSVSKGIMALSGSIERMRSLLNEENMFGCVAYFSNVLAAATGTEARHQRLGDSDDAHDHEESNNSDRFV